MPPPSRALEVNVGLKVLLVHDCGISPATTKSLEAGLTKKPVLTWEDQKLHAEEAMDHFAWLRKKLDDAEFPFRVGARVRPAIPHLPSTLAPDRLFQREPCHQFLC